MTLFDPHTFGPGPGDRVIERPRPRQPSELRQLVRWFRAHEWPAQAVLVLGAVAIAAVLFVFGLMVGTGIAPMVGGGQRPAHSLTNCRTWPRLDLLAGNRNM
jgi:hypothetical protein